FPVLTATGPHFRPACEWLLEILPTSELLARWSDSPPTTRPRRRVAVRRGKSASPAASWEPSQTAAHIIKGLIDRLHAAMSDIVETLLDVGDSFLSLAIRSPLSQAFFQRRQ